MQLKLPLATPLLHSYLHHAYQTAVLGTEKDKTLPWVLSNFIQLYYDGNDVLPVQIYMPDNTGYTWNILCPWFDYQMVKKDMLNAMGTNIVEFVIQALNNGYYVMTYVNERYIPAKWSYGHTNFSHMFLIHGYDLEKRAFVHTGYSRAYSTFEVTLSDFENSFHMNPEPTYHTHDRVYLFRMSDNFKYEFNITHIQEQMHGLLYSKPQTIFNENPVELFGFNVYDNLVRITEEKINNGEDIIITPFLLLSEHKKLMHMRLAYLEQLKLLDSLSQYPRMFAGFEQRFLVLRNIAFKFNTSKHGKSVEIIGKELKRLKEEETELMVEILDSLQKG